MRRRPLVAILVAVAMVLAVPTVASGQSSRGEEERSVADQDHPHEHPPGLGEYGPQGLIRRADLPEGIRDLVSDRAIEVANGAALADARTGWDLPIDFVDQIDYQLDFRSQTDYLSSDSSHLGDVLERKPENFGSEVLGLLMTDEESDEFERRLAMGEAMVQLREALGQVEPMEGEEPVYSDNFGGIWMDQMNGGKLVLAITSLDGINRGQLQRIARGQLIILENQPSLNELHAASDRVQQAAERLGIAVEVSILSTPEGKLLDLNTASGQLPESVTREVGSGIRFEVGDSVVEDLGLPQDVHSWADQQPGLAIRVGSQSSQVPNAACTWGANGHTSSRNYLVTSAHCFKPYVVPVTFATTHYDNFSGFTGLLDVGQSYSGGWSRLLTPGSQFLKSVHTPTYDFARISSPYANDNCYHRTSRLLTFPGGGTAWEPEQHCIAIENRASHNSWEPGQSVTCASLGASNAYRCGFIFAENHSGRLVAVSMKAVNGDSGSGAIWQHGNNATLDGIVVGRIGNSTMLFQTAYDAKVQLGFDFNCYPTEIVRNASQWGSCPVVSRAPN